MSSGQPRSACGARPDENQVSSTSSSWRTLAPHSRQLRWVFDGDGCVAVLAVPDRDLVAPPELAADAPVADVVEPVEVHLLEALGDDRYPALAHDGGGRARERAARLVLLVDVDPPLLARDRLDHGLAAAADADAVGVVLDVVEEALVLEVAEDRCSRLFVGHAGIGAGLVVHPAVAVDRDDHGQVVALADLPVHRVVAGGDFHGAGAELGLDRVVGDDRDLAADDGQKQVATDTLLVALVGWVHGHAGVADHRLGARRGDDHVSRERHAALADDGVAHVVELRGRLDVVDLEVAQRGLAARAPVDHPQAAVDEPVFVEVDEGRADGLHDRGVEGEDVARPVSAGAELAMLIGDAAAVLADPHPGAADELLTAEVLAAEAFLRQLALDDVLGGDAGVVLSGEPERGVALHAVPADEDIGDGVFEAVAKVKLTGHVRGRHDDAVGRAAGIHARLEVAGRFPHLVDAALYARRLVGRG